MNTKKDVQIWKTTFWLVAIVWVILVVLIYLWPAAVFGSIQPVTKDVYWYLHNASGTVRLGDNRHSPVGAWAIIAERPGRLNKGRIITIRIEGVSGEKFIWTIEKPPPSRVTTRRPMRLDYLEDSRWYSPSGMADVQELDDDFMFWATLESRQ